MINNTQSVNPKINFPSYVGHSDEDLRELFFARNMKVPVNDNGKLMKSQAIQELQIYDRQHPELYREKRRFLVRFQRTSSETMASYVFLSLNGTAYQVPYDTEVWLPEDVLRSCVDNAVETHYEVKADDTNAYAPTTHAPVERRPFAYTILDIKSEDDYRAMLRGEVPNPVEELPKEEVYTSPVEQFVNTSTTLAKELVAEEEAVEAPKAKKTKKASK